MLKRIRPFLWPLAIVFLLSLILLGYTIYSLSAELETKFYAAYDSVPTKVYSSIYWLRRGVGAGPEEIRYRLKERDYRDMGRVHEASSPGTFSMDVSEQGQITELRLFTADFNYPSAAKEQFFGDPQKDIHPSKYTIYFQGGSIERVLTSDGTEVPEVALEPTLIAQLNEAGGQARKTIPLGQMPHTLMKAIVLVEDQRFLDHGGIDPRGIARSIYVNLRAGGFVQGASTITQQLARNIYLTRQKTITRKLKEIIMSIMLEFKFSKDQILEKYLNEVYFGQSGNIAIHGVSEAAKFYFGKTLDDISIAEQALLAGIVRGPFYYSPFRHFERVKQRQELVLGKMHEAGVITERQFKEAVAAKIKLERVNPVQNRAPYFTDMIQAQLMKDLPEQEMVGAGYTIFSTLDTYVQNKAEESVSSGVGGLEARLKQYLEKRKKTKQKKDVSAEAPEKEEESRLIQGAFIAVNPTNGHLLGLVGGRAYEESNYNRALLMRRHIGSLIKPFVYLAALIHGKNPDGSPISAISKFEDKKFTYEFDGKSWAPSNYEEEFEGTVTLRYALAKSINTVAAQVAIATGLDKVVDVARLAGFDSDIRPLPSLSLGAIEVPPMEVATAYTTLANFGLRREITSTLLVVAEDGHVVAKYMPRQEQVLPVEEVANLVNIMTSVFEIGSGKPARDAGFNWPAAGKTGTTNEFRDAWFSGFTNKMLAISWVGFDRDDEIVRRNRKALKLTGAVAALPAWVEFMKSIHKSQDPHPLPVPNNILRSIQVDLISGARANYHCMGNNVVEEVFTARNAPTAECN